MKATEVRDAARAKLDALCQRGGFATNYPPQKFRAEYIEVSQAGERYREALKAAKDYLAVFYSA